MAGNSYTADEAEIKSEDIRRAVYKNRIANEREYWKLIVLATVFLVGLGAVMFVEASLKWRVDNLEARVSELERRAYSVATPQPAMMPVRQPTWLKYSLVDDAHVVEFVGGQSPTATKRFDLTVQIHSDPEGCYLFPDEFPKGRNLVEVVGKGPIATVGTEDLILFHQSLIGGRVQVVYGRVDGPNIEWFAPQGQTNIDWGDGYFYGPATINLSPMVDGIAPWISFGREDPSAYAVGDTVFHPKAAIER